MVRCLFSQVAYFDRFSIAVLRGGDSSCYPGLRMYLYFWEGSIDIPSSLEFCVYMLVNIQADI